MTHHFDFHDPSEHKGSPVTLLAVITVLGFMLVAARLWYLQVLRGPELMEEAEQNYTRVVRQTAPRGLIVDRNNLTLAMSRPQFVVSVIPADLEQSPDEIESQADATDRTEEQVRKQLADVTIKRIANLLGLSTAEVAEALGDVETWRRRFDAVVLMTDASRQIVASIEENGPFIKGLMVQTQPVRYYPDGLLASHVLGALGKVNADEYANLESTGVGREDYIGKSGIELRLQNYLQGTAGGRKLKVDATGRQRGELAYQPPIPGCTVQLTLDKKLQRAAEAAFGDRAGAVVAMNPKTGEILAMNSFPRYDPNIFSSKMKSSAWKQIANDRRFPLQNRALAGRYPPGSTFKMVTAAAALKAGAINSATSAFCPGYLMLGKWRFGCWSVHHTVNLDSAIAGSCDVYFYKAGLRTGMDKIASMAHAFGLGEPTGIDLPGAKKGSIPTPDWKLKTFHERWYPGDTCNSSIGQGYISVTPLQVAQVACVVANKGVLMRPYVIKCVRDGSKTTVFETKPQVQRQVDLPDKYWQMIQHGMVSAVSGQHGTAKILEFNNMQVAGKTGSAEDPPRIKPHAWIVAYAPANDPQIAICVFVEQGGHGGSSAGPVARKIISTMFNLNADNGKAAIKTD
ncbi:MAG: penicillin-binding protein 2 [Armatimonadota bacterium]